MSKHSKHSLPEGWEQLELGFVLTGPPRTTWTPGWYRSEDSGEVIHVATWGGRRAVYRGMLGTSWAPSGKQTVWTPFTEPEPE